MTIINEEKLGKIVQLARDGVGGEKTVALSMVKRLCLENGLNIDDVMHADERIIEQVFKYKDGGEKKIIVQMCWVFGQAEEGGLREARFAKRIFLSATAIRCIETAAAVEVYLRAYRKEKRRILKDLPTAFIMKHDIYDHSATSPDRTYSAAELEEIRRQFALADTFEDVVVRKQIGNGN